MSATPLAPVTVAVIGLGGMGTHHVRTYRDLEGARLAGLADPDPARREAAALLAPGVPVFASYATLLAETQPAAVSVVVPTLLHVEAALAALTAGAHVLVEKPIAGNLADGAMIVRSAAAAGRLLMVGHVERFNPAVRELKRRLDAGDLGRVYQIRAQRVGPFPARIRDVGVVHDLAPHDIDVMRYLLGDEVERVYAETGQRLHTEHEDMLAGTLRFRSGVIGILEVNWLTPEKVRRLRVQGERGAYELDYVAQTLDLLASRADAAPSPPQRVWPPAGSSPEEPLRVELAAFLDAIRTGGPSPMPGADGLAALDIAAKLVESGAEGRAITVAHPIEAG